MRFYRKEYGLKIDSHTVAVVTIASYCYGHVTYAFSYGLVNHEKVLEDFDGLFYHKLEGPEARLTLKTGEEYQADRIQRGDDERRGWWYEVDIGKMLKTAF